MSDKDDDKDGCSFSLGNGVGCFLMLVGLALVIWVVKGCPGLAQ